MRWAFFLSLLIYSRLFIAQPNIIWITCEDLSADWLACYGDTYVKTPNLDQLAGESVKYTHAFTTAGVCAPSRAAIITGMYQTAIGAHQMRTLNGAWGAKYSPVQDYSAVIPTEVKCFPELLRTNGYYCSNNEKQDYQFEAPVTVWDEQGGFASWEGRKSGQPFFAIFNVFITHESQLFSRLKEPLEADPAKVTVPPFLPDTKTVRQDIARLYTNVQIMDRQVGEIIARLKSAGVYDDSYVFFYSDHGGMLPWTKREVLERGTHIPLLIKHPKGALAGRVDSHLVSSIDFAPTVLSLAGIRTPSHLNGQAFLGKYASKLPRQYVFAARDRMDTEYDRVRSVRDARYRYVFNYMPEKPYYQDIEFRTSIPSMKEILQLHDEGKLTGPTVNWFKTKPVEELYDVHADPFELHNLVNDPQHKSKLYEMRQAMEQWKSNIRDLGAIPEKEMISNMWEGKDKQPETSKPKIKVKGQKVFLSCSTPGASIGYRVVRAGQEKPMRPYQSWDQGSINRPEQKGKNMMLPPVWSIYTSNSKIKLMSGDTLKVQAQRIGFAPSINEFVGQ